MSSYYSPRYFYKSKAKVKKRSPKKPQWISFALFFLGLFSFYCVLFPENAGLWGSSLSRFLDWLSGVGRFLIPVFLTYWAGTHLFKREEKATLLKILLTTLFSLLSFVFFSQVGQAVWNTNSGGVLGLLGQNFFAKLFGDVGSWIVNLGFLSIVGVLLLGSTPQDVIHQFVAAIKADWAELKLKKLEKEKVKENKPPVVQPNAALKAPPKTVSPKIINGAQDDKPGLKKDDGNQKTEEKIKKAPPIVSERNHQKIKETGEKKPSQPSNVNYTQPSLEIFEAPDVKQSVSKEELTSRARLLEQTLANFNIAAVVVEIHPGPVITRYDLEPAPGVKVSSISSRAADLALAMKSTGIRVLAPIPGKGAVGVEIPNLNPEKVGLQELLGRPEFYNHKSPLAFVLGKTVSGDPCIVDLAAMPHMLIAGATGAGKSVAVHSLISSILYRMPPDRVKFVLIDPKRLELPSYVSIPHLYDPNHSPIQAEVITNSKQAAKALSRLVKVMEYRYDLFAKANVRNIDSYNQKRKEAGLPPEYYLVVIIDELADLMLTSPKEVEDSIQRLAQMARAVGIHLVLATQRPSVDVITGVIKANLPSRIALRVASAIDSRVIIDTVGAELLLGKGDMLYLPPASPDPIRVQGAFVSEKEVENLVQHVKAFGLPEYDDLFGMGSALEFAVEDKKEMKDLIEALKLVLERHRVSQDLLKAHFGSSARATNILSLLEVKEFIRKPEGSNRWEINFDMIEEFLGKVNNIPEEEIMS